jgi:hypothetical protein
VLFIVLAILSCFAPAAVLLLLLPQVAGGAPLTLSDPLTCYARADRDPLTTAVTSLLLLLLQVAGGDPLTLSGPLTLCARADRDPLSFFSGQLSQLSLFDQPLGETQVAALYAEYSKQALLYPHGAAGGLLFLGTLHCIHTTLIML